MLVTIEGTWFVIRVRACETLTGMIKQERIPPLAYYFRLPKSTTSSSQVSDLVGASKRCESRYNLQHGAKR
jgi:hypothetical protein